MSGQAISECDFLFELDEEEGGWGECGWGLGPWGGGEESPRTRACVRAIRENVIRAKFTRPLLFTGLGNAVDSQNINHFSVSVIGGEGLDGNDAHGVRVILIERVDGDPNAVDICVDRALSHYPVSYVLHISNLYDANGALFAPSISESFDGLRSTFNKPVVDTYAPQGTRDFANPTAREALFDPLPEITTKNLGTFPFGDDGDYGHDEGPENLKKRVIRRCLVRPGGFVWLQKYGVGIGNEGKKLSNAARRERIKATIRTQVMQEPDVRYVTADFRFLPQTPGLVWLVVKVVTTTDHAYQFDVPFSE